MEIDEISLKVEPIVFHSCAECSLRFSTLELLYQHVDHHTQTQFIKTESDENVDDYLDSVSFVVKESCRKYGPSTSMLTSSDTKILNDENILDIDYKESDEIINVEILFPDHESYEPLKDETKIKVYEPIKTEETEKYEKRQERDDSLTYQFDPNNLHECEKCGIRFADVRILRNHMRFIHKEKISTNDFEPKLIKIEENIEKVSTVKRRRKEGYKCEYCEQQFKLSSTRSKHVNSEHKLVQCGKCDKVFAGLKLLKGHERDAHFASHECEQCGRKFSKIYFLKKHFCCPNTVCHICNKKLASAYSLRQHLNIHTGNKPYECKYCDERFETIVRLKSHTLGHTGEKRYECEICHEKFSSLFSRNLHQNKHLGRRFECEFCEYKTFALIFIKRHTLQVHTRLRRYTCEFCGRNFPNNGNLIRHRRIHTGEKPYECKYCDKKFNQSTTLKIHVRCVHFKNKMRLNMSKKLFKCSFCEKKYFLANDRRSHEINMHIEAVLKRNYTRRKRRKTAFKYECSYCEKRYSTKCILTEHERTHTDEKEFECTKCERKFYTSRKLKAHVKSHSDEKAYECMLCLYETNYRQNLLSHVSSVHNRMRLFKCVTCKRRFSSLSNMLRHQMIHTGEKPFECHLCEWKFAQKASLISHIRTHTGEKPYQCNLCDKKYADSRNLKRHKLSCN